MYHHFVTGTTAESFLEIQGGQTVSQHDQLKTTLANILGTKSTNVDIINLRDVPSDMDNVIDIIYVAHGSPYYPSSRLNGLALVNQGKVSRCVISACYKKMSSPTGTLYSMCDMFK